MKSLIIMMAVLITSISILGIFTEQFDYRLIIALIGFFLLIIIIDKRKKKKPKRSKFQDHKPKGRTRNKQITYKSRPDFG